MNRRQFLTGAGGATLTIPLLGSLQPAHAAPLAAPKRFFTYATHHGGLWDEYMWPSDSLLTENRNIGHTIRRGALTADTIAGNTVLSTVLTAPSDLLTPSLVDRMNLIRGLDIPFYISHHTGGFLGNYGRNDQEFGGYVDLDRIPTIDQVMAWSDGFYGDTSGMIKRSMHVGWDISFGWANPNSPGGQVDPMPTEWGSADLFRQLFGDGQQQETVEPPRLVVDKVLESYRRVRHGAFGPGRRISIGDGQRLDAHIERLYEVERKLNAVVECTDIPPPSGDTSGHPGAWGYNNLEDVREYYQLWNEVMALGMICGASRIGTMWIDSNFYLYGGDWHQEVAHEAWVSQTAVDRLVSGNREFFEFVFCDMLRRLDVPDCDGQSVLDNSLVFWGQESGAMTHDSFSTPVVCAGSLGGQLSTGNYVDYRNRNDLSFADSDNAVQQTQRPGLLYSQWLATVLRASGVRESEWVTPNNPGYGVWYTDRPNGVPGYIQSMGNEMLPFLTP